MLISTVFAYLPYTIVTAFTPGPNNIIALYAISQNGWGKGKRAIFGIGAGFIAVMLVCAVFCYQLARYIPSISNILKYVGAAYIFWLAIHVARSKPEDGEGKNISFWNGFFLQFLNVKIIMYAITTYTGYVLPVTKDLPDLILHAFIFSIIGISGTVTWAAAGKIFQSILSKYHRPFNWAMAAILAICAVKLL